MTIECRLSHGKQLNNHSIIETRIKKIIQDNPKPLLITLLHLKEQEMTILIHSQQSMDMKEIEGIVKMIFDSSDYSMNCSFITLGEALHILESNMISQEEQSKWKWEMIHLI